MTLPKIALACALFLAATQANAAGIRPYAVSITASTLGLGGDVITPISQSFNLRGSMRGFRYHNTLNINEVNYNASTLLANISLLTDYYPVGKLFHLSGGVVINNNKLTVSAKETGNITLNNTDYSVSGKIDGDITFNPLAGYLGIGLGNPIAAKHGWQLHLEGGVMYQGRPDTALSSYGTATHISSGESFAIDGNTSEAETFNRNIEEEVNTLNDKLVELEWFPVISLGLSYRFQ